MEKLQDQSIVNQLKSQIENLELKNRQLSKRANTLEYTLSPELSQKKMELKYHLDMAAQFSKSGAFPNLSPEKIYVLMKAGLELGLSEMESLTSLYIVNGSVQFHSKGLVSRITKHGYKIEYQDETDQGVTVRIYHPKEDFDEKERVTDKDQVLVNSKAMKFAKKHKMRYHGIRMIANFHLPHLFGSVAMFEPIEEEVVESIDFESAIASAKSKEDLTGLWAKMSEDQQVEFKEALNNRLKEIKNV